MLLAELTLFLIDLSLYVEIDGNNEYVGNDVHGSHTHEYLWVVERNLFRYLHHAKYDHEIRAAVSMCQCCCLKGKLHMLKYHNGWTYI